MQKALFICVLMKKFLVSILAVLYLSTSLGATIHLHYCMGKLIGWGLISHDSKNCNYCGMPRQNPGQPNQVSKNHCCDDQQKQIRTDRDQTLFQAELQFFKIYPVNTDVYFHELPVLYFSSIHTAYPGIHAPPPVDVQPVFLLNCNFRI